MVPPVAIADKKRMKNTKGSQGIKAAATPAMNCRITAQTKGFLRPNLEKIGCSLAWKFQLNPTQLTCQISIQRPSFRKEYQA